MNRPSGSQETADTVNKATVRDCTSIALPFVLMAICLGGLALYLFATENPSDWLVTAWVLILPLTAAYLLYRITPESWPVAFWRKTGLLFQLYVQYYLCLWWVGSSGYVISGPINRAVTFGGIMGILLGLLFAAIQTRLSRQVTETRETVNGPTKVEMIVIPKPPSWAVLLILISLQALAYLAGLRLGGRWLIF